MRFHVTVNRDEGGVWIVECPAIPGCVSQGKTKGAALDNIKEAIALCLAVRAEKGLPLTIETQQIEVEVLLPTEQLPTLSDLFGIAPGATGEKSSEQFVRELRDRWDEGEGKR